MFWFGMVWYGMVWYGMVLYGMVYHYSGIVYHKRKGRMISTDSAQATTGVQNRAASNVLLSRATQYLLAHYYTYEYK